MTAIQAGAEEFLRLVEQCRRGRLQICLGHGLDGGQARRLLEEAQHLSRRGLEVVLGFLETPDPELRQMALGLEGLPKRRVEYRGVAVEEMDLAAILARRPQVAVVQDLAHANVPGSRHASRHEDVEELLRAGVSVLASADLRQLESLPGLGPPNGSPAGRHGLPEPFWRLADRFVLADPEEGHPRLPPATLAALRLAGCRQGDLVQAGNHRPPAPPEPEQPWAGERIMVCLPGRGERDEALLRAAEQMAARRGSSWFAVHVAPPPPAQPSSRLESAWNLATRLKAETVLLKGKDPLAPLLDFARSHGVRHIILGRSQDPAWRLALGRALPMRMLAQAAGFHLHVLNLGESEG